MKVHEVIMSEDGMRAVIWLKPSWLGRLFGARYRLVELLKSPNAPEHRIWTCAVTHRALHDLSYGSMIREALSMRPTPRSALPFAKAREMRR